MVVTILIATFAATTRTGTGSTAIASHPRAAFSSPLELLPVPASPDNRSNAVDIVIVLLPCPRIAPRYRTPGESPGRSTRRRRPARRIKPQPRLRRRRESSEPCEENAADRINVLPAEPGIRLTSESRVVMLREGGASSPPHVTAQLI